MSLGLSKRYVNYDMKGIKKSMEEHNKAAGSFNVRSKVWIENDEGEVVLGPGVTDP